MADATRSATCFSRFNALGSHSLGGGATTSFLLAGTLDRVMSESAAAQSSQYPGQLALSLQARAHVNTADTAITVELFKNGRATGVTVVIPAGSTDLITNTTSTTRYINGDTIDFRVTAPAGSGKASIGASVKVDSSIVDPGSGRAFEIQQGACFNRLTFLALLTGGGGTVNAFASLGDVTLQQSTAPAAWNHDFPGIKCARLAAVAISNSLDATATITVLVGGKDINTRNANRMRVSILAASLIPSIENAVVLDFRAENKRLVYGDLAKTGSTATDVNLTNHLDMLVDEHVGRFLQDDDQDEVREIESNLAARIDVLPGFTAAPANTDPVQIFESLPPVPNATILPIDVQCSVPAATGAALIGITVDVFQG